MNRVQKSSIVLAVMAVLAGPAAAQDADMFKLSGFGTLGVAHSSEDKADVTADFQTDKAVGASGDTSMRLDSRLGVQVDARFSENFSGVLQVVSEYAVTQSYSPQVTLAHVKYRFGPNFSMRVGRINTPLYMLSEFQRVGYAVPWARPPQEVYNYLVPLDGVEGTYKWQAGEAVIGLQGFYGRIKSERAHVHGLRGLAVSIDYGDSSVRMSHIRGQAGYVTPSIDALFNFYRGLPIPPLAALAARLDNRDMPGKFSGIGYSYDPGSWFLRAEVIQADYAPTLASRTTSGYLSSGMRIGSFTPSITVAHVDRAKPQLPGSLDSFNLLNAAVLASNSNRHSISAALRWDIHSNLALKFQASHVKNHAGSYGDLGNLQPGFVPGRSYNLVSASLDFVF